MKYTFQKMNKKPIPIEQIEDEHEEKYDYIPSFWWNNKRYYLKDFIRCHNNPWILDTFPEYIHGYEAEKYYHPIYIEIINSEEINVYEEREVKENERNN